jgi:uncharacterized damage-inducible protein DinB
MLATELAVLYARDLRRLRQEIEAFPDTASLWETAPGVTNAAGTLALHLEGNIREYIGRQLGRIAYTRDRPLEFNTRGVVQADVVERMRAVEEMIPPVIASMSEDALSMTYPEHVLGTPLTTRQLLIHLSGHLNYHLGQIDYLRRMTTGHGAIRLASL